MTKLEGAGEHVEADVIGMLSVAAEARGYAATLQKKQDGIDRDVHELMTSWTGPAADSYVKEWDAVRGASDEMIKDLKLIAELIENAAYGYDTTDGENSDVVSRAGDGLPSPLPGH